MTRKNYGWKRDLPDHRDLNIHDLLAFEAPLKLPTMVDLRSKMVPCFDQGQVGSCTGNATAGALELDELLQTNGASKVTPSRLFLYYNARRAEGSTGQDAGAQIRDVVRGVAMYGYCHETQWPYTPSQTTVMPSNAAYQAASQHKLTSMMYARVAQNTTAMKQVLASQRGIIIGFTVYESFEHIGANGMMPMPRRGEQVLGGHAVLIVGYDDAKQCFIVRNSWGTTWGDHGHFYMPYSYATSQLASDFWTITAVPANYTIEQIKAA